MEFEVGGEEADHGEHDGESGHAPDGDAEAAEDEDGGDEHGESGGEQCTGGFGAEVGVEAGADDAGIGARVVE